MTLGVCLTKAPTLKDLRDQIDIAIYRLGKDALWTGYEDGRIYMWRENKDVEMSIKPKTKYQCETAQAEVFE